MSIPAQPTPTTIVTEAWKLFGKRTPTSADITRAIDYGLEMVKSDLKDLGLEWDPLRTTAYLPCTVGVSYVQLPTDYAKAISVKVLDGSRRGTAQAAASTTLTLAADDTGGSETVGKWVVITSATAGSGQARQIKSYDSSTKVATLESAWTTTPTGTIVYLVVDEHKEIDYKTTFDLNSVTNPGTPGKPTLAATKGDAAEGDLYFNKAPDKVYGIELEYYADILKIDVDINTSTLYNRLLRLFNGLFIQGVFVWCLQDDSRYGIERQIYEKKKAQTAALYLYPHNIQHLSSVLDYP